MTSLDATPAPPASAAPAAPAATAAPSTKLGDQYQRWDRFDVDAAIAQADADAVRAERRRARTKARQALEVLDATVFARAHELYAAAMSRSNVERLRAKRKRGRRRPTQKDGAQSSPSNNSDSRNSQMQVRAQVSPLATQKFTLLENLLKIRAHAEEAFRSASHGKDADNRIDVGRAGLEAAISSGASLLALLSAASKAAASPHLKASEAADAKAAEAACGCSTPHNAQSLCLQPNPQPSVAIADKEAAQEDIDLCAVCLRALNDVRVYLSRVLLGEDLLTDAADELKTVLLSDTSRADAWYCRGAAFLRMGVPLLAELHFKRAVEESSKRNNPYAVVAEEGGTSFILFKTTDDADHDVHGEILDATQSLDACKDAVSALASMSRSQKLEALGAGLSGSAARGEEKQLRQLISQGHAIFQEGYFNSAALRYEAAVRKVQKMTREQFGSARAVNLALLRALALEAHLRIAECLIERKMGYRRAILHCSRALRLKPENAEALRLRAYSLMERSEFALAMEDLRRARSSTSTPSAAQLQRAADSGNSIPELLARAKHRCETWMKSANYSAIKQQQALARRPRSKRKPRMSIVLFVYESLPSSAIQLSSSTMKSMEWMSRNGILLEQNYVPCAGYPSNLEAILTGVHPVRWYCNNSISMAICTYFFCFVVHKVLNFAH